MYFGLLGFDVDVGDQDVATATSKYALAYGAVDIAILLEIMKGNGTEVQVAFGLRYATRTQELDASNANIASVVTTVNEDVDSAGFGLYFEVVLRHVLSENLTHTSLRRRPDLSGYEAQVSRD